MLYRRQDSHRFFSRPEKSQKKRLASLREATRPVCELLENRLLLSITEPTIGPAVFNITSFGATTGSSNNASDIQAAINAAAATSGGGTVEIPAVAGNLPFLSGPLTLASNVNLQIDQGAILEAIPFASYPGHGTSAAPTNFITGKNINNFEITGRGVIDGQGAAWWMRL